MTNEQQAVYIKVLESRLRDIATDLERHLLSVLPKSEKNEAANTSRNSSELSFVPCLTPLWDFVEDLETQRVMLSKPED
jgi:hypothetical protein